MIQERLTGKEIPVSKDVALNEAPVLDFWQWAFSNLMDNDLRGIYAEWLVGKLLDVPLTMRSSWANWDLEKDGVKIEVKCSAYCQAWEQKGPSRISFGRLKSQAWEEITGYHEERTYHADLYVFCLQSERDKDKYDSLDLDQWQFYLLTNADMESIGCRSIGLSTLEAKCKAMTAAELREKGMQAIERLKQG